MERRHYTFFGQVQGVGFRYRAQYAAQQLELTGWVCNRWDGTVELEAQGKPEALDRLAATITGSSRWIEIEHTVCEPVPVKPLERNFRILSGD